MSSNPANTSISIGRLLRSSITGCAVGCLRSQQNTPTFGQMVRIPMDDGTVIYGLIYDIHIDDDGLVRQLVSTEGISTEVIEDNRVNRNVPLEMSVIFVGYEQHGYIYHLLPPRPPLTLDVIEPCSTADLVRFTSPGQFGYLRLLLRDPALPTSELLAVHLREAFLAHQNDGTNWQPRAVNTLVALLKDDYTRLTAALGAISEIA
jgi:hypothetical protein